jgi:hypothetical protein
LAFCHLFPSAETLKLKDNKEDGIRKVPLQYSTNFYFLYGLHIIIDHSEGTCINVLQYKQVFRECLISAALISMGQNWGGDNYLGTWSIHLFRDVNISIQIVSILDMDLRVWLAQICAKLEQNLTRIDNYGKMTLT